MGLGVGVGLGLGLETKMTRTKDKRVRGGVRKIGGYLRDRHQESNVKRGGLRVAGHRVR